MRLTPLVLLVACSSPASSPPPHNVGTGTARVPADLGSLVIVTTPTASDSLPGFVPVSAMFPVVDPTLRMPPNTPMRVVDARGAAGTFTSGEPTKITHGCDGNQLGVTPLVGTTKLSPGIAWAQFGDAHAKALTPVVKASPAEGSYNFGGVGILVQRDSQKLDHGLLRFIVDNEEVRAHGFVRTLMDGADPKMATIDIAEGGPGIPRPLAAWSIDGSGKEPYLVAIERPGWEGTSIEAWLVDNTNAKQIEPMTSYLYQCAF